jgi:Flp pilus assembly protein TadB
MTVQEKSATGSAPGRSYPALGKLIKEDQMDFAGGDSIASLGVFLIPIVGSIALFSFLAVTTWSDARRKEREAYYTTDALKKISESSAEGAKSAVEYLREQNKSAAQRRVEGLKLGGLITAAVGVGVMVLIRGLNHDEPAYLVGLIPLLVGLALLVYAFGLAPKE